MKKFFSYSFIAISFVACKNAVGTGKELRSVFKNGLIHSIIKTTENNSTDSLKANSNRHFNFFLKDGLSKKFGL